jgi:hypothetical protein
MAIGAWEDIEADPQQQEVIEDVSLLEFIG